MWWATVGMPSEMQRTRPHATPPEAGKPSSVVAALAGSGGSAVQLDGKLVDRPIEIAAERALALGAHGVRPD